MKSRWLLLTVAVVGLGFGGWQYWSKRSAAPVAADGERAADAGPPGGPPGPGRRGGFNGPTPVLAETVKTIDVPVYLAGVGTVTAYNSVTILPQIDGKLIRLGFSEGQEVKAGDLIAELDPATYKAAYDQAVATKAKDLADLANARRDLIRYQNLARNDYGSKQQADTQAASVAQLEAQVQYDQAQIDSAAATLAYTTIKAPIDGRTGIRNVDVGNIVHSSDTTGIVTITQLRPISIVFTIPEQSLADVLGQGSAINAPVEAIGSDNRTVLATGRLAVVNNQIDETTGTVKLKATFGNEDESLWPGRFVNVRVKVRTLKDAVVVPTGAVQQGPRGPLVFVIGADSKVKATDVTISRQDDSQTVIASGLKGGERIVTSGFVRLADGSEVKISTPEATKGDASGQPGQAADGAPERHNKHDKGQGQGQGQTQGQTQDQSKDKAAP